MDAFWTRAMLWAANAREISAREQMEVWQQRCWHFDNLASPLLRYSGASTVMVGRRAEVPGGRVDNRMRSRHPHRRSRLLDHRPILAVSRRAKRFIRSRRHASDREYRDCGPAVSRSSSAPRRQKPARRMQTATLLRVSHNSSARGLEAVEGRVADLDRCFYGERNVQLQLDAERVSGRACADPCLGLRDGIRRNGFGMSLYLKTATSGARITAHPRNDRPKTASSAEAGDRRSSPAH
jgi:hypothetical protein